MYYKIRLPLGNCRQTNLIGTVSLYNYILFSANTYLCIIAINIVLITR